MTCYHVNRIMISKYNSTQLIPSTPHEFSYYLGGLEGVEEGDETVEMEEEEVPVPKVDPDGWETVVRGTKKTGKKK